MALFFLYSRGECGDPNPEYREDTLELLQRRRSPGGQSIADSLHKNAFKITRDILPRSDRPHGLRPPQPLARGPHEAQNHLA